jgi:hypothetical protein
MLGTCRYANGGYWRNATIPRTRPWCHYVMAELNVGDLLPIDFAEVLGSKGMWCAHSFVLEQNEPPFHLS